MLGDSHAGVIDLGHALRAGWVEFAYQPKIALDHRQVVGVEMFVRVRHPFHGLLPGATVLPGADERVIAQLTIFAIRWALQAASVLALEGVRVPITVNVPASAVMPQALGSLLSSCEKVENWAGLILDVPKGDILANHAHFA